MINLNLKFNINPIQRKPVELKNISTGEKIAFKGSLTQDLFKYSDEEVDVPSKDRSVYYENKYIQQLIKIVKNNPYLPIEEQRELILKYRANKDSEDPKLQKEALDAREKVVNSFMGTALKFSKKYYSVKNHSMKFQDIVSSAIEGIYKGIDEVDVSKEKFKLSFYIRSNLYLDVNTSKIPLSVSNYAIYKRPQLLKDYHDMNDPEKADKFTQEEKESIKERFIRQMPLLKTSKMDIDDEEKPLHLKDEYNPLRLLEIETANEDLNTLLDSLKAKKSKRKGSTTIEENKRREFYAFYLGFDIDKNGSIVEHGLSGKEILDRAINLYGYTEKSARQLRLIAQQDIEKSEHFLEIMKKHFPKQALLREIKSGNVDESTQERVKSHILKSNRINDLQKQLLIANYFCPDDSELKGKCNDLHVSFNNAKKIINNAVGVLNLPANELE